MLSGAGTSPMRTVNKIAVVFMLLFAVAVARAEVGPVNRTRASANMLTTTTHIASVPQAATVPVTLPPEEKPKTHWPWWLRILAVIGVLVFIRLVAGSVRNNPGKPGPSGS
jgi:hypothetical protein